MTYLLRLKAWVITHLIWIVVCVAVVGGLMLWSFLEGKASCTEASVRALEKELKAQEARSAKAVKQAVRDQRTLTEAKTDAEDLTERARALPVPAACIPDDDGLRLLREARERTKP